MNATTNGLLKLWGEIYQEALQLCEAIEALPDKCECGDAEAHLEGRCRCCGKHGGSHGTGESCTVILARLRANLSIFCQDFSRLAGPLQATAGTGSLELRRGIFLAATDLQQIVKGVERVSDAVVGFRRTCDLSELHGLKRHSAELREHCTKLNATLEGDGTATPEEAL